MKELWSALIAAAVLLVPAALVHAQTNTASIGGVVKDPTGSVVPGATITATHPATGISVNRRGHCLTLAGNGPVTTSICWTA